MLFLHLRFKDKKRKKKKKKQKKKTKKKKQKKKTTKKKNNEVNDNNTLSAFGVVRSLLAVVTGHCMAFCVLLLCFVGLVVVDMVHHNPNS